MFSGSFDRNDRSVSGDFVSVGDRRFYLIRNVDSLKPFLTSVISSDNHWLFVSSTGGLTAGRVSPDRALFPYLSVDKLHECSPHTGNSTVIRVQGSGNLRIWEPFNFEQLNQYAICRNLYKTLEADVLRFEEINYDLMLVFRYTWRASREYGFIRSCELENLGPEPVSLDLLDGLRNILPAGTPRHLQTTASNLVDSYKWHELDSGSGLGLFTLYAGITDRAEPCESLKASTVFCLGLGLGLPERKILLSSTQLGRFRRGAKVDQETQVRGVRGAYLVHTSLVVPPESTHTWQFAADIDKTQSEVLGLIQQLANPTDLAQSIEQSVQHGADALARLMASADALQTTSEELVSAHHYANVLFNVLRGGTLVDQYTVPLEDFRKTIKHFNFSVFQRNRDLLDALPSRLDLPELVESLCQSGDSQLERLSRDYLPIFFGRRHGDPSRPWNHFEIALRDENNEPLLSYEGNWRDIFQNWEALLFSYPELIENVIAKFVNASTVDGYNPYCISKSGIDWTVQDPQDPWSYIGYWGDHQIIYLLKLLELSGQFHPSRLSALLRSPVFSYANVPYRIKPFAEMLENPRDTITYNHDAAALIERRIERMGHDGKLVMGTDGEVYQVNLLEKLMVPLLSKLCNLVIDGGIWMNTQRPEWNDANNALAGYGLSVVTLCYLRRYVCFMQQLLQGETGQLELSNEVGQWLSDTTTALGDVCRRLNSTPVTATNRMQALESLGKAASLYREAVYEDLPFSGKTQQSCERVHELLENALTTIDHCIATNQRDDGLYHAYNLIERQPDGLGVSNLYLMLEGQVAALSSGAIPPETAADLLESLYESDLYRADQHTFMLYPDRSLPGFLETNCAPNADVEGIPLLVRMLRAGDRRIIERDPEGKYRFSTDIRNAGDLRTRLDTLGQEYVGDLEEAREPVLALHEKVFNHRMFTGRSGSMFGFEGLGCIYWHMVSKLLLATQENFFCATADGAAPATCLRLGRMYYRIRAGLGFNKTPGEYGAFPTDPYSHTPRHSGARQPGMTGQVKEEVLCRFGELGVRIEDGAVRFDPRLLREREFTAQLCQFRHLDIDGGWQTLPLPAASLAFTWCQVPIVYLMDHQTDPKIVITRRNGTQQAYPGMILPQEESSQLFRRSGQLSRLTVTVAPGMLFAP